MPELEGSHCGSAINSSNYLLKKYEIEEWDMDDLTSSIESLKSKYHLGSIYLTVIPLNDMAQRLSEDLTQLVAEGAAPRDILQRLKAFLAGKHEAELNQSIAFVQLELNTGKAGFKTASDRDGVISPIAWSQEEVFRIAKFSDAFLNRLLTFDQKHSSIAAGDLPLDEGLKTWKKLKADPYIPTVRKMVLDLDWRSQIDEKSAELKRLKSKDPKVYDAIQTFSKNYDKSLSALTSEEALEPLRIKSVELGDALEIFKTKQEDYLALLHTEPVENSLRTKMRLLEEAGLLTEGLNFDYDFIQLYRGITGESSLPKIETTEPLLRFSQGKGRLSRGAIKGLGGIGRGGGGRR
jgi:hypothetical protein